MIETNQIQYLRFLYVIKSEEKNFVWLRIAKCASSSLNVFLQENVSDHEIIRGNVSLHKYSLDECFTFCFVRNPWERLLSCWKQLVNDPLNRPNQRKQKFYLEMRNRDYSFEQFLKIICTDEWIGGNDHHRPYSHFFELFGKTPEFIGKIENFSDDVQQVLDKINIPLEFNEWRNKTEHKSYEQYYTPELKDLVEVWYRDDIEQFEYEFGK